MLLAVLTISDRCSDGLLTDTAGPAVVALLRREWPQAEIRTALFRDDENAIAAALEELSGQGAALALTVGGTGLGPRDRTPEATQARDRSRSARTGGSDASQGRGEQSACMAFTRRGGNARQYAYRESARQPARRRGEPEDDFDFTASCARYCGWRAESPVAAIRAFSRARRRTHIPADLCPYFRRCGGLRAEYRRAPAQRKAGRAGRRSGLSLLHAG